MTRLLNAKGYNHRLDSCSFLWFMGMKHRFKTLITEANFLMISGKQMISKILKINCNKYSEIIRFYLRSYLEKGIDVFWDYVFGLWFVLTVDYVHVQPSLLGMKKANRRVKTVASSIGVREHAHSRFTAQVGSPLHGSLNGPPLLLPGMYRPPHCTWQTPGAVQGHSPSFITLKEELLLPTPPFQPRQRA